MNSCTMQFDFSKRREMNMKRSKRMFVAVLTLCLALSMALASVTVNAATKKPKKIYLKTTASTVDIKGKVRVTVKSVSPKNASKAVKYKSSNKKVATVSSSGYVTGKKKGTVKITVTSKKNKKAKKTIKIKVKDLKASSVTLSKTSALLTKDMKTTLKATVKGSAGFYNQGVTWKSSNASVASVDSKGNVTAKAAGTAKITATEKGGSKTATCTVTVKSTSTTATVNTENKSVTIEAVVMNPTAKSMHYVVSSKGNQAGSATMVTNVSTTEFEKAMSEVSATAWNTKSKVGSDEKRAVGEKIYDLAKAGIGNSKYSVVNVTVTNDGTTKAMNETLNGASVGENLRMIYANVANDANAQFGCITCNTSCYSGMVANELETTKNPFTPKDLPSAGTVVKITYTVNQNNYISPSELSSNSTDYVIIDSRAQADYTVAHVANSVSADVSGAIKGTDPDTAKANVKKVVDDKGTSVKYAIICYSGNKYANFTASYLRELGVDNDNIYILGGKDGGQSANGGMNAWLAFGGDIAPYHYEQPIDVFNALKDSNHVIIDMRKSDAYKAKHIAGAVSVDGDSDTAKDDVAKVVEKYGKDKSYDVICYSGNKYAKRGTAYLISAGVAPGNIYTLSDNSTTSSENGGMKAWSSSAYSLAYSVAEHTSSKEFYFQNSIDPLQLKTDFDGDKVYTVLDVRPADKYNAGHIEGAINTPYTDEETLVETVKNNPNGLYVLACVSGNSMADAARNALVKNGVSEDRIICLQGGMNAWIDAGYPTVQ